MYKVLVRSKFSRTVPSTWYLEEPRFCRIKDCFSLFICEITVAKPKFFGAPKFGRKFSARRNFGAKILARRKYGEFFGAPKLSRNRAEISAGFRPAKISAQFRLNFGAPKISPYFRRAKISAPKFRRAKFFRPNFSAPKNFGLATVVYQMKRLK